MDNRPTGRQKNVTGKANDIEKKGEGLGTGPVGRQDGYEGRRPAQQAGGSSPAPQRSTTRAGGKRMGIIGIILALLLGGGGFGLNSILGGNQTAQVPQTTTAQVSQANGIGSFLNLLGGGQMNAGTTVGWNNGDNTGKLDRSVAEGSRDKRTVIYGDGRDVATVMVYMCGTDLESRSGMASNDLREMASATIGSNVNVIVYTGGCLSWKTQGISNQFNQIHKISGGKMTTLVQNDGTDAMTKPATLTRFINYCKTNYPANRNMLIFWDHGGGSISGFGYDERNKSAGSLGLAGINNALKASGMTFDFIGFDACLMGTLETALTLEKYADYLIGSEETEPGVGWYYTNWLTNLSKNTATPTLDLAKTIIDDFVAFCAQKCPGQKTTLSVTDLAELAETVPDAFKEFSVHTTSKLKKKEYKAISDARSNTREFATSNKIDQVDLVDLAYNIKTDESVKLAEAVLGAVKYNKTSQNMANSYGLAIYFPYYKTGKVQSAVQTYEAIGLDSSYTDCVKEFAGLEASGQIVAQNSSQSSMSPMPSLFGSFSGSAPASTDTISTLLNTFLGGGGGSSSSALTSIAGSLLGRSVDVDSVTETIAENQLDTSNFVWTKNADGDYQLTLTDAQWSQVHSVLLNTFYDDGEGYIDLGLDNVFSITEDGALVSDAGTWLAIDGNVIPYYYDDEYNDGTTDIITGHSPVLINGKRAELIIVFENGKASVAGARFVYVDGETDTVAKGVEALTAGDKLQFICDYYSYDGEYKDSYKLGDEIEYNGANQISDVELDTAKCSSMYMITDSYNNEYFTPVIPND
ncbi:MAG: peptidase C11 [Clostridia bacterium]|nr:peptidase C11 [Clostridia bacterium]